MTDEPRVERLTSGVAGLDAILNGGFIQGGIYLIQGPAGAGKTILGNQLCCHRVQQDGARKGRALFVTLLAEAVDRMLLNIGGLGFFDPNAVPESLHYVSGLAAFEAEGLKGLLELIRREVRTRGADILVIDGLGSSEEPASASASIGEFTHLLQAQNSLLGCTTFLLSRGAHPAHAERTVVDGLIELTAPLHGLRRERRLELSLFRGSDHLRGEHAYEINDRGVHVYPRLEALLPFPAHARPARSAALARGVTGLDHALGEDGVPAGCTILLEGPSGAGKSALAMQFVASCGPDERGVVLSFSSGAERARKHAPQIGVQLGAQIDRGALAWLARPTRERGLDSIGHELLERTAHPSVTRLVIDGLDGFEQSTADDNRLLPFVAALLDELRARGVTTVCTGLSSLEGGAGSGLSPARIALPSLFDVWINVAHVKNAPGKRTLTLLKATSAQSGSGELTIDAQGIRVGPASAWDAPEPDAPVFLAKTTSSKPPVRPKSVRRK